MTRSWRSARSDCEFRGARCGSWRGDRRAPRQWRSTAPRKQPCVPWPSSTGRRHDGAQREMTHVMLVGGDVALLEGLAQSLAALGHAPQVARSLAEARELSAEQAPLVLVVDRALASSAGAELLGAPLAAGGARLLYPTPAPPLPPLLPALQRAVLADLTLPLERHRPAAPLPSLRGPGRPRGPA